MNRAEEENAGAAVAAGPVIPGMTYKKRRRGCATGLLHVLSEAENEEYNRNAREIKALEHERTVEARALFGRLGPRNHVPYTLASAISLYNERGRGQRFSLYEPYAEGSEKQQGDG
jgi:hypothetical protein